MIGKLDRAPCGHMGEHIIGNYVRCSLGCDQVATEEKSELLKTVCSPRDPFVAGWSVGTAFDVYGVAGVAYVRIKTVHTSLSWGWEYTMEVFGPQGELKGKIRSKHKNVSIDVQQGAFVERK